MHKEDAYISTQAGFSVVSVFNVMLHDFELIFQFGSDFLLSDPQGVLPMAAVVSSPQLPERRPSTGAQ